MTIKSTDTSQPTKATEERLIAVGSFNGMASLQNSCTDMPQLQGQPQSQANQQTTTSQSQPTSAQNGSSGATDK